MSLAQLLQKRLSDQGPVRIGLIDAGKFGSMFLSQVPTTPGLEVTVIADLDPQRATRECPRGVFRVDSRRAGAKMPFEFPIRRPGGCCRPVCVTRAYPWGGMSAGRGLRDTPGGALLKGWREK